MMWSSKVKPGDRVKLYALTGGQAACASTYVLTNVVDTGRKFKGRPVFAGTVMDLKDLQYHIDCESPDPLDKVIPFRQKLLLCVHGFNTTPGEVVSGMRKVQH